MDTLAAGSGSSVLASPEPTDVLAVLSNSSYHRYPSERVSLIGRRGCLKLLDPAFAFNRRRTGAPQ
jgi:hypothetical protein